MIVCGIDQSTSSTGITVFSKDKKVIAVELIRVPSRKKGQLIPIENRILSVLNQIEEVIIKYNCSYVFLEGLSYTRSSTSARPLAGLYYGILMRLLQLNIPYKTFPPLSVKAFALKGNSSKEEIFEKVPSEIKELFLQKTKSKSSLFDLSDSYFIGLLGLHSLENF